MTYIVLKAPLNSDQPTWGNCVDVSQMKTLVEERPNSS